MTNRQNRAPVIVLVLLLLAIAAAGVVLARLNDSLSPEFSAVVIPRVSASISGEDGEVHTVHADVAISGIDELNADMAAVQAMITEVIEDIGYERLSASGGTEFFREELRKQLPEELGEEAAIYFANLASDMSLETGAPGGGRSDVFNALFPNAR